MLTSYAVGLIAMTVLVSAWWAVQEGWRRTFPAEQADADVLSGRMGCAGCGERDCTERAHPAPPGWEEESR